VRHRPAGRLERLLPSALHHSSRVVCVAFAELNLSAESPLRPHSARKLSLLMGAISRIAARRKLGLG